jgi:hypothetical protein
MSQLGQTSTKLRSSITSLLIPDSGANADILEPSISANSGHWRALLDHLVGADEQRGSNVEANRLGDSLVDHQLQALPCNETALLPGCRAGGAELHQAGSIRVRPARLVVQIHQSYGGVWG